MLDALGLRKPFIRDYSRLNFVYTVLSKRKLQWFVDTGRVSGWNDPRFPTIQGIMRRGMTVEALREFILGQGFSMSANLMEWDKIWTINKRIIDPVAPRYNAVASHQRVTLYLDNAADIDTVCTVDLHPKNAAVGRKAVTRSSRVLLEQDDAKLIKDGEEVRARLLPPSKPFPLPLLLCCRRRRACVLGEVHHDDKQAVVIRATVTYWSH
jgi:glutamyl-tRNA synthetase